MTSLKPTVSYSQDLHSFTPGNIQSIPLKSGQLYFLEIGFLAEGILLPPGFFSFLFLVLVRFLFFFLPEELIGFFSFLVGVWFGLVLARVCEFCR